jgi:hypothetical protein
MVKNKINLYFLTIGVLILNACVLNSTADIQSQKPIYRYDLITAEKILPNGDLYPPILHSDEWETPHPIEGGINSAGLEDSPFITPDGDLLFFFYTPSSDSPAEVQIYDQVTGIYRSEKSGDLWQEPARVVLTKENQVALDGCPFFLNDALWFCSIREGNFRDIDIWTSEWNGVVWKNITNTGAYLNQDVQIEEMHLSADGKTLIYHKADAEQSNGYDLWQIQWNGNEWGVPEKLNSLNSQDDDSRPALSPNGEELWFTRTYNGTPAIFRSMWVDEKWAVPELIISQFAGEPSIDTFGNIYFTHHFFQEGKMIEADIYIAEKE